MAVSSGLKRSQRVSKCVETLGAEHIRESQAVSRCHETLGDERIHASHKVTRCHATLVAGPTRASRRVSTGPTTLGAECIHRSRKVYGTARLRHFFALLCSRNIFRNTTRTPNACAGQGDAQACHNASSQQTGMQSCRIAPAIGQDLLFENERSSTARSLPSGTTQRNCQK